MTALALVVTAVAAFLVGSIPFGYLIGHIFHRTDIRTQGSGNIGAMNALRTLGTTSAVAVLLLDAVKGGVPVLLAQRFIGSTPQAAATVAAIAAVLGHCFSPWLNWKGGKGVATSFGAVLALSWPAGLVAVGVYLGGALLTRYSSVGSMLGNLVSPLALAFFTRSPIETLYGIFAAVFIAYTHRENIERLRSGTENPIRLFKRPGNPKPS